MHHAPNEGRKKGKKEGRKGIMSTLGRDMTVPGLKRHVLLIHERYMIT
jgi:hypothetical protein